MQLGTVGIWRVFDDTFPVEEIEALGFTAAWIGGSPSPRAVEPLLARSTSLTIATGIVNVWRYPDTDQIAGEHAAITSRYPGRFLLGIGVGHTESVDGYTRPLSAMTRYFDGLDSAPTPVPPTERITAALGPKMLELAAERSLGTHTYFSPLEHTRFARAHLGPEAQIAPEIAVVLEPNPEAARRRAREYAALYLDRHNYRANIMRFGFRDGDFTNGGSDRLIDTLVPHGSPEVIADAVSAQFDAGASHVCLQPLGHLSEPGRSLASIEDYRALARVLY